MTFEEVQKYFERLGETRMRLDLGPSTKLLEVAGRPDRKLSSIVVGGTNGKGSTCAFLTAIAQASGLRVGTSTSPHLENVMERIAVDGRPLSSDRFCQEVETLRNKIEAAQFRSVTYFEFITVLAAQAFATDDVDLAIFEVGLGGRLDTTNALDRKLCAITRIDFDHKAILGNTLEAIAREKGALMRKGSAAVIGTQMPEAEKALLDQGNAIGAQLRTTPRDYGCTGSWRDFRFVSHGLSVGPVELGLPGRHQIENAAASVMAALELVRAGVPIDPRKMAEGLRKARNPGRLERFQSPTGADVWLDVGHNPGAARAVAAFFMQEKLAPLDLVIGVLEDKDWRGVLTELSPIAKSFTLCRPHSPRAWNPEQVVPHLPKGIPHQLVPEPVDALHSVLKSGSQRVLCTGSFYTVGEIRSSLRSDESSRNDRRNRY